MRLSLRVRLRVRLRRVHKAKFSKLRLNRILNKHKNIKNILYVI